MENHPPGGATGTNTSYDHTAATEARRFYRLRMAIPTPPGFALIPAGNFVMGNTFTEGELSERPVRGVTLDAFFIQTTETTKAQWDEVYVWAQNNGYNFETLGSGIRGSPT